LQKFNVSLATLRHPNVKMTLKMYHVNYDNFNLSFLYVSSHNPSLHTFIA